MIIWINKKLISWINQNNWKYYIIRKKDNSKFFEWKLLRIIIIWNIQNIIQNIQIISIITPQAYLDFAADSTITAEEQIVMVKLVPKPFVKTGPVVNLQAVKSRDRLPPAAR